MECARRMLVVVFVARKEEKLIAGAVELEAGNKHRTADRKTGVHLTIVRSCDSACLEKSIICVQGTVTTVEVNVSMKLTTAALAERLKENRPLGILRSEGRIQNRNLGGHILVDVNNLPAHLTGISDDRTIEREFQPTVWHSPTRRE